jgi:SM-20-related protein
MEIIPHFETIIDNLLEKNYAISDDFFSADEIAIIRKCLDTKHQSENFKKSGIGNKTDVQIVNEVRGDFIYWIDELKETDLKDSFFKKINNLISYLNQTCYLGIKETEFHFAIYPVGTFYKRHLDTFQNDNKRKLSIVCYLNNQQWHDDFGGQLVIYQSNSAIKINPQPGRLVIFESQLLEHEVLPVNQTRYSITGWLKTN